ncbi:MAG TPA: isocitrate lyase/phosphoenolpyruvate mutase family protein [Azospirillaceae bacterium]|nr:isocitrate lyase/phosphoenolpyruvate mutase family protein [Azospirillaceae bacterium]
MSQQTAHAETFRSLHVPGRPLVLFNAWDAGSARAVAAAGALAIGTGSWSVAAAHGYEDGEKLPLELALANLRRIVGAVTLPVTIDLETGYAADPAGVAATVAAALAAGAVGVNLEDSLPGTSELRPTAQQAERLKAARAACERAGVPAFVNARTDVFFRGIPADEALLAEALERARAYADAGADGLFVPGLVEERLIGLLAERSPLPVNIMAGPNTPPKARLAELGVARLSHGPGPYRLAMQAVEAAARAAFA